MTVLILFNIVVWSAAFVELAVLGYLFLKDKKQYNKDKENEKNVRNFMREVPKTHNKSTYSAYGEKALYNETGDMIWNSVQGCVGKTTYIDIEEND